MHLCHGRTTPPPRTTPIALHSHQQHLLPLLQSFPWMRLHLRAPSRPRPAGRARHGIARTKATINILRAVAPHKKTLRAHQTKKPSLPHTCLLDLGLGHVLKPLRQSHDSTRDERSVSTHMSLKTGRFHRHALDHRRLWCDKVNEKKILLIALLVS